MRRLPSWFQKIGREIFQRIFALGIFGAGWASMPPLHSLLLCLRVIVIWLGLVHAKQMRQEIIWIAPKKFQNLLRLLHLWRFRSAFRHFGTHFAKSFRMSKSLWMMDPTLSREMLSCSAIDLAEIQRSSKIGSWICQQSPGRSLFWVVQDEEYHRWKNHHV